MQNNTLMLNNIFLDEIIKAKLVVAPTKNIITESAFTQGDFDLATVDGTEIGWTAANGIPWTNSAAVSILKSLGAKPFACTKGKQRLDAVERRNIIDKKYTKGPTDIGYQVLIYSKKIGALLRFYKDGTMTATGAADNVWGWKLKNGSIYLTYNTPGMINNLNWTEGYLENKFGTVKFVDTRAPGLKTTKEKQIETLQQLTKYAADHNYRYGVDNQPSFWQRYLDKLQTLFDWAGIIWPPIDVINALIYTTRERYLEAVFSVIALVPVVGDTIGIIAHAAIKGFGSGVKLVGNSFKYLWIKIFKQIGIHSADRIAAKLMESKEVLRKLSTYGVISKSQFDEYLTVLSRNKAAMDDAVDELTKRGALSTGKLAKRPEVIKKLGIKISDDLAKKGAPGIIQNLAKLGLRKYATKAVAGMFRSADSAVIALFNKLLYTFSKKLAQNPKILALALVSFADKKLFQVILQKALKNQGGVIGTMAKKHPKWFNLSTGPITTITGINPKYTMEFLNALKVSKAGKEIYANIADDVYKFVANGTHRNYFWDLYKTNPFREVMARMSNPVQRLATAYGAKGLSFWPKIKDVMSSTSLWKKADIIYNEWVKHDEITAGYPDFSKNSVVCILAYKAGIYKLMGSAQQELNNNPEYKWIENISPSAIDDRKSYEIPGATDSTTFQNWDARDLDAATNAQQNKAWKTSQDRLKYIKSKAKK